MTNFTLRMLAFIVLLTVSTAARGTDSLLQPGKDVAVQIPGNGGSMIVFLPTNYSPDRRWPSIFHFHGMNGTPTTSHLRPFTHDRDFIIVGMPYLDNSQKPRTPDEQKAILARELQNYRNARSWISTNAQVDQSRVFMSGVSRGGWTTSILGEMDIQHLAGIVNMLAGRMTPAIPPPAGVRDKPVYIGAGETDGNLVHAMAAADTYRRYGAITTFEEYPGVGHSIPPSVPGLEAWLDCHGRLRRSDTKDAAAEVATWFNNQHKTATEEPDPVKKALLLRTLLDDSRTIWFPPAGVKQARDDLASLRSKPPVKNERDSELAFNNCLARENTVRSVPDMKTALDAFSATAKQHPETKFGKLAATHAKELSDAYEKTAAAANKAIEEAKKAAKGSSSSKHVNVTLPSSGSGASVPGPGKKTGNKITFGP